MLPDESDGSTAIVVTRPVTGEKKPPVVGVGPIELHEEVTTPCGAGWAAAAT